mgnify:CR=1 FL=1
MALERGRILALLGRNGAGKSTLLRCVAGLIKPAGGSIRLAGLLLDELTPQKRIQMGISFVAQNRECFPDLTVTENIEVAMSCLGLSKAQRETRRSEVLSLLPALRSLLRQPAHRLSGGQQQLLVLAMAICQRPRVLLLDEPSLGLDQVVLTGLLNALQKYVTGGGAVLLVEQKLRVASAVADQALYLENGRIEMEGTVSGLLDDAGFLGRYLGIPTAARQ